MRDRRILAVMLFISFVVFMGFGCVEKGSQAKTGKEGVSESFAPGTYKTYKNDDLGFSFKYPKKWYLNRYEKLGFYYFVLSNREGRLLSPLSGDEVFEVEIYETRLPDRGRQTTGNIIKKISDKVASMKIFKEISVAGGTVYLVRGSSTMIIGDVDFGYIYLVDKKGGNGGKSNYLIEFVPTELSKNHVAEYLRVLRSVEIFSR